MAHLDSEQAAHAAAHAVAPAPAVAPNGTDTIVEGGLAAPYVVMGDDEAIALARQCYGLDGTVTRFATEKDDTFCVQTSDGNGVDGKRTDGKRYVLKVANPSEDVSEIALQAELLQHIAQVDPTLPVPRILPDHAGRAYAEITDRAGQRRQVRLMSYLEGTPLDRTRSSPSEREHIGEVLGRLRNACAGFSHPAETRVLAWDVKHLQSLRPLLDDVTDAQQKARLAEGLARFAMIAPRLAALPSQVLHNDFNLSNIVVDHAHPGFVTGIIDFGDAVRTAVAIDVATALLNQLPRDAAENPVDDLFAAGRDLLRGYYRHASLSEEELAVVPHLVMARVVARALITLWRARRFPENSTYILRNTQPGWAQLDWFLARSMDEVSTTLLPVTA